MNIVVGDVWSSIQEPRKNMKALAIVRSLCRARPEGYMFMPKFKSGRWDGYISLMKGMNKFPSGLLDIVMAGLQRKDIETTLHVQRTPGWDVIEPGDLSGITLRDYQLEAIHSLLIHRRGVAKMATNSGKTEVMAGIIKALHIPKTVVVLHRKELLHQTADRFSDRLGIDVGKIGDGIWDVKTVTVAMVQTLSNRGLDGVFDGNVLLMIDECHHASSDQMMDVLFDVPGCYRFGFSGTPLKHDILSDMKLIGVTGEIVVDVSNEYLVEEGYSAKPTVLIHVIEGTNDPLDWELEYQEAYEKLIVINDARNHIIADFASNFHGLVLILVDRIDHGKILKSLIFDAVFVNGSDTYSYRNQVLEEMRQSKSGVVIASPIFNEGVDVPSVDAVVVAGGGVSHVNLLQKIGRGMRAKSDGDNSLTIVDFLDDTNTYLLEHSDGRIDVYIQEGFDTELIRQT